MIRIDRPVLPQDPIEIINYLGHLRNDLRQRFFDRVSIVEQYLEGMATFHLHLGYGVRGLCLCYGHYDLTNPPLKIRPNELTVLIDIGETVEQQQRLKSVVRLEFLDECDVFVSEMAQEGFAIRGEFLLSLLDRKLCAIIIRPEFVSGVTSGQDEDDVIKSGARVQDKFADVLDRDIEEVVAKEKIHLLRLQMRIVSDGLHCVVVDGFSREFKILHLFGCPVYPELRLLKRAHREAMREKQIAKDAQGLRNPSSEPYRLCSPSEKSGAAIRTAPPAAKES